MTTSTMLLEITQILAIGLTTFITTLSGIAMVLGSTNETLSKAEKTTFNCLWFFALLTPSLIVFKSFCLMADFGLAHTQLAYEYIYTPANIFICIFEAQLLYLACKIIRTQLDYVAKAYEVEQSGVGG